MYSVRRTVYTVTLEYTSKINKGEIWLTPRASMTKQEENMMEARATTFGDYIAAKRKEKDISLRRMADLVGLSAPYWSDIEKNRKNPPSLEKLAAIAKILGLSETENREMLDLAGDKRDTVAPDIPAYIRENDYVAAALRTARDLGASEDDWEKFVADLKKRKG